MNKINIGIIGTSEIAFRRFLPSLEKSRNFRYIGIASRDIKNTDKFIQEYGGKGFGSYEEIIHNKEIEALYIPLPPALHYKWAKEALKKGKHVLLEKPSTMSRKDTQDLVSLADSYNLALDENYMFKYHRQLGFIKDLIKKDSIGELRLVRIQFGFPMREKNDFRYNKELGGGDLLYCGGYTINLACNLLGSDLDVKTSRLNYKRGYEVDIYGSAVLENKSGLVAQISFGMDNNYKCELEIWGNKGYIVAPRIFTAPPNFKAQVICKTNNEDKIFELEDDQFLNSIENYYKCIIDDKIRKSSYEELINQSKLVEKIRLGF